MRNRLALLNITFMFLYFHVAECNDVLSIVTEKLNLREEWSNGKKFVWDVNVSVSFEMTPHAYEALQRAVAQSGGQLLDRSYTYKTSFQITAARKGNRLVISGKATNDWLDTPVFIFIDEKFYIVGTFPVYAVPVGVKPDRITEAYIFACRQSLLYDYIFPQPFLFVEPGNCFFYGLLVSTSPLRFFSGTHKIAALAQSYQLEGYDRILGSKIVVYIGQREHSLKSITHYLSDKKGYEKKATYSFGKMGQTRNVEIYDHIMYEKIEESPEQRRKVVIDFRLRRIESLSERDMEIALPIGTVVSDFRKISKDWEPQDYSTHFSQGNWDGVVRYIWQGTLPSDAELERLAYQQGNLLPSDTPRRRYTLWLFIPALVFFALAAYFYFKRKRR